MSKLLQTILFCAVAIVAMSVAAKASDIPDVNATVILSFPLEYNGKTYGNPAISDIGPDGKLYVGLAGNILNPFVDTPKGIFRYGSSFSPELVIELPGFGGFIEKLWFSNDGYLYVCLANYYIPNGIVSNGVIRVDIVTKTYIQIWASDGIIVFPAGLGEDSQGRLYISDPILGLVVQIDKSGNVLNILDDPKCKGTAVPTPTGCNGLAVTTKNQNDNYLYTPNFDQSTIVRVSINNVTGAFGSPEIVYADPSIVTFDQLSADPSEHYLFSAGFGTGIVGRINIKNKNKIRVTTLTQSADGLGFTVQALPSDGFEDSDLDGSLFVNNLDPFVPGGGSIWLLKPECDNPGSCSFY